MSRERKDTPPSSSTSSRAREPSPDIRATIIAAADFHAVPHAVALAFADVESGFNPRADGDIGWAEKNGGRNYQRVLADARLANNPARDNPAAWHSYGLYQLLALYHVGPSEDPSVLYEPSINANRGCKFIGQLLQKTNGNVEAARLAYVGCGADGRHCSADQVAQVRNRIRVAVARWGG